jgi:HK97 family phage major capsid protein
MSDYRALSLAAKDYQEAADKIRAKAKGRTLTADEEADIKGNEAASATYAELGAQARDREQRELRDVVTNGHVIGGTGHSAPTDAVTAEFYNYIKTGDLSQIRDTAISTTDANGGYLLPEAEHQKLLAASWSIDPILARAARVDISGGAVDTLLPYISVRGTATTAAEVAAHGETTEPTFSSRDLIAHDYFSSFNVSQTFLDSWPEAEQTVVQESYGAVAEKMAVDAAVGTGSTSIKGLFTESAHFANTQFTGSAAAILNTSPSKAYFALDPRFLPKAAWVCAPTTLAVLAAFADPAAADTKLVNMDTSPPTIYGHPVLLASNAPALGAGNYALAFGDISQAFVVATHRTLSILRDPYTAGPPWVRFVALTRVGGCGWDPAAMVLMRCATS